MPSFQVVQQENNYIHRHMLHFQMMIPVDNSCILQLLCTGILNSSIIRADSKQTGTGLKPYSRPKTPVNFSVFIEML